MELSLTHSQRKFIRQEKASIRSRVLDAKKQEELITQLYGKFNQQPQVGGEAKPQASQEAKIQKSWTRRDSSQVQVKNIPATPRTLDKIGATQKSKVKSAPKSKGEKKPKSQ